MVMESVPPLRVGRYGPTLIERGLDLIFPPSCVGCRRIGHWICPRCSLDIAWIGDRHCALCDFPSMSTPCASCGSTAGPLRSVMAAARFDGTVREAVHAMKY